MDSSSVRRTQVATDDGPWKLPQAVQQPGNKELQPVFDLPQALRNVDEIEDLLVELVGLFFEECPKLMQRVRVSIEFGDAAGLTLAAHTLKGAASNLAASELVAEARQLEEMGRQNHLADAELATRRLERAVDRLLPHLHGYHDRMNASGTA